MAHSDPAYVHVMRQIQAADMAATFGAPTGTSAEERVRFDSDDAEDVARWLDAPDEPAAN